MKMLEYEKHIQIMQKLFYLSKRIGKYEVPISSIITLEDKIIGIGHNKMVSLSNPNNHAEIMALEQARNNVNNFFFG
jgi:tRNA(Arg) A34 adenosine deaminase TadA